MSEDNKKYIPMQPPPPGPLKPPGCICEFKMLVGGMLEPHVNNNDCPVHGPLLELQRQKRAERKEATNEPQKP